MRHGILGAGLIACGTAVTVGVLSARTPAARPEGPPSVARGVEAGTHGPPQGRVVREATTLQRGWRFARGSHPNAFQVDFDDSGWDTVSVPHDWAISGPFDPDGDASTAKLPWRGEGWYRNAIEIPSSYARKRVYLIFDGVMALPRVYVNGKLAGSWDYGYAPFYLDVTDDILPGRVNLIAVHADTRQHESRWYPGAGIYRKVRLLAVDPIHVGVWGTYVTTPVVKPDYADVRIQTTILNQTDADADVTVHQVILSPEGHEVARGQVESPVRSGESLDLEVTVTMTDPRRWELHNPVLYTARTTVTVGDTVRDIYDTPFGVRTMRFSADHGFYLNDHRVQLHGVNLHHDQGPLGAAFYPAAERRKLQIMKLMGANAIRTSHNMPAPEVPAMADSMGLLVLAEAFDEYDRTADITDTTDFDAFAHRNMRNFVVRFRNHPSIFLWSVGNEIGDVQRNVADGFERLRAMVDYVREYDPSRPVTVVGDSARASDGRAFDDYDVLSWDYHRRWDLARRMAPDKAVIIGASASTLSTRGFYEIPLPEKRTDFTPSLQMSSYDLNAPPRGEIPDDDFMWQDQDSYIAGEFVWSGFDYLGEPTPYDESSMRRMGFSPKQASRSSYSGIVDLVGIPKDRYYLYRSRWKPNEASVHILPHWNWRELRGDTVPVFVYTNGDCAELLLNGRSQGMRCKRPKSDTATQRTRLMWMNVIYEPGELQAVAFREGAVIGRGTVTTTGSPTMLRLTPDRSFLAADGMDLSYILIEALDPYGNPIPLEHDRVHISVDGPARIAGVGNGNPQSFEPFQADHVYLFNGKAMLILGSGIERGPVKVTATSPRLEPATTTIEIR